MAVSRGLACYIVGAVLSLIAGLGMLPAWPAYSVLAAGRIATGIGESLVLMGSAAWGIGLVGPARAGTVLSFVGAAVYGATAAGAPLGVWLLDRIGFPGVMAVSTGLPALGYIALARVPGVAVNANATRPSFRSVLGRVLPHSVVICLHGIGFAAISAFFSLHFLVENWAHAGLGLTAFGMGFVLVRLLCSGLPDRIGGLQVALGSLALEFVGQVLIWRAHDPVLALTGAFLTGLGCSMLFPAMGREVVHRVEPQMRATALGAFAAFQDISFGLTGPAAGYLADRAGYNSVYLVGAVAAALAFGIVLTLRQIRS